MQQNKCRALAPEGCFHPDLPESASFSATSSVVPQEAQNKGWALAPAKISVLRNSRFGSSSTISFQLLCTSPSW
jgi:hypothetical protein